MKNKILFLKICFCFLFFFLIKLANCLADDLSDFKIFYEKLHDKRKAGLLYDFFCLVDFKDIENIRSPFLCIASGDLVNVSKRGIFFDIEDKKGLQTLTQDEFIDLWDRGFIIAPIPTNVWCDKGKGDTNFYIIYAYHDDEFERWEKTLNYIFNEIEKKNKKIAYIDELGLIPYESVEHTMRFKNISEEEAFQEIKKTLEEEIKNIKTGVAIYDSNSTYNKLYTLLARNKVECYMEDLTYDNWKEIVNFDALEVNKLARLYFLNGDIGNYVMYKKIYIDTFWKLNVKQRDEHFAEQLEYLIKNNPDKIFFTIRGIGHLGLEEKLINRGINTRYIILGNDDLEKSLINQQIIQVCRNLDVEIPPDEELKLILGGEFEEFIRAYLMLCGRNILQAIAETKTLLSNLSKEKIRELFNEVKKKVSENKGKITDQKELYKLIYSIIEAEVK